MIGYFLAPIILVLPPLVQKITLRLICLWAPIAMWMWPLSVHWQQPRVDKSIFMKDFQLPSMVSIIVDIEVVMMGGCVLQQLKMVFVQLVTGEALYADVYHNLTRATGFEGIMVVRCTDGLKVNECYGNYFRRRPHEMELPSIDCDKAV